MGLFCSLLSSERRRSIAAKKKRAIESPATTTQRFVRAPRSSVALMRCAPHLSASLDHCQLSVWSGPQVATLSVLVSQLLVQHQAFSLPGCYCVMVQAPFATIRDLCMWRGCRAVRRTLLLGCRPSSQS